MQAHKVISSLTFRYIARYLLVLSATVFLVVVGMYSIYSYNYFSELSQSIVDEEETLQVIYAGQGLPGVRQYVEDQGKISIADHFYYLVTDIEGDKLAGDLPQASDNGFTPFLGQVFGRHRVTR